MSGSQQRGGCVLVVDDEPFLVETVCFALEKAGYECLTAADGEEALRAVAERRPDLILLDLMLPKLNGFKVCRQLKSDPGTGAIPIVMLTARTQERDRILGRETGADEYVTKPFEIDDLLEVVARRVAR